MKMRDFHTDFFFKKNFGYLNIDFDEVHDIYEVSQGEISEINHTFLESRFLNRINQSDSIESEITELK